MVVASDSSTTPEVSMCEGDGEREERRREGERKREREGQGEIRMYMYVCVLHNHYVLAIPPGKSCKV